MDAIPNISVVVATYNRAETLRETLRHLEAQRIVPESFEVIVVDDGSTDDTRATVEAAQIRSRFALQYLYHANHGPGYTQNCGIRAARAPIILLIADDIFLAPNALSAHLTCHTRNAASGVAVLGRVLQSPALTHSVFLSKWEPWPLGDLPDGKLMPYHMFWACNISFKRDFMLEYGMFRDEPGRAGAAAHEDVELGYRLHQHGLQVIYGREALGYHHHVETLKGTLQRSYQRGLNWHDFRRRVPQPEIDITYRAYTLATLLVRGREISGPRHRYLLDADKRLPRLAARYLLRRLMFNRLTVNLLWLPLFAAAERVHWLASCVRGNLYRGVIVYFFLKGCDDGRSRYRTSPQSQLSG
ncbi:MAG: glycosyltransferase [Propionivibrio sp.]|uniref:Glycosyltransferase n=1 Tax=Candidatus Propionivibrio dominans TaxID=2954373 RepID=A0A9D7FDN8_9RHOO|nr:glycosyltransferase [Candidatus Propionivibrio dominans]